MTITENAPAKLNLALHVRARADDGYHVLETLFTFVRDGDVVTVLPAETDGFAIDGPFAAGLAADAGNLVLRARDAFRERWPDGPPVSIALQKNLPIASGIGGGSADAAATLRGMARLQGVAVDDPSLFAIAAALGADVPACLAGGTTIGSGRGERLRPVPGLPGTPCLLVNPGVAVPTGVVFAGWDRIDRGPMPVGDARSIALAGRNDLQPPAAAFAPVIDTVLSMLAGQEGAWLVRMSGSGATCFALFNDAGAMRRAAADVRALHPEWWCLETALA